MKRYIKPTISAIRTEPFMVVKHSNNYAEGKPKEWIEEEEMEEPEAQDFWGIQKPQEDNQWGLVQWEDNW